MYKVDLHRSGWTAVYALGSMKEIHVNNCSSQLPQREITRVLMLPILVNFCPISPMEQKSVRFYDVHFQYD